MLFDLDGTLADTAPDLAGAVNAMRVARGMRAMPVSDLRAYASHGARGLIGAGLGRTPADTEYAALRDEFLGLYERDLCVQSRLFDGIDLVLDALAARSIRWGVVTNKATRFTEPLVALLGLTPRAGTVVSGDTTAHSKPHPAPLLFAAAQLQLDPKYCVYVGDDLRDIQAGQAAGMLTVAAAYGYCAGSDPNQWGADALVDSPSALLALLS